MKKFLASILSLVMLLSVRMPALAAEEALNLLWDIPFGMDCHTLARNVEKLKGIEMDTAKKAYHGGSTYEFAYSKENQDISLFGLPFLLYCGTDMLYMEEYKQEIPLSDKRIIYFEEYLYNETVTKLAIDQAIIPTYECVNAQQAYDAALANYAKVWNGVFEKYGTPETIDLICESGFAARHSGNGYLDELKICPVETLWQGDQLADPLTVAAEHFDGPRDGHVIVYQAKINNVLLRTEFWLAAGKGESFKASCSITYNSKPYKENKAYRNEEPAAVVYTDNGL